MAVTLKEVASKANLSVRTVSRILNTGDASLFLQETRQRVEAVAREMGYRPNGMARSMRSGRRGAMGLLLSAHPERSVVPFGVLNGLQHELSLHDLHLIVGEVPDQKLADSSFVPRLLREWSTDGMIVVYTQSIPEQMVKLLTDGTVPSIWLNAKLPSDCVYPDDFGSGREMTRYLLKMGHRRIDYLAYARNAHHSRRDRLEGYLAAMQEAGLGGQAHVHEQADADKDPLRDLRPLLTSPQRATAYVASTASEARALYVAGLRLGLQVPRDFSICGIVDDLRDIDLGGTQFTAMDWPRERVGMEAAKMSMEKVAAPGVAMSPRAVPYILQERDSCAPPSQEGM